MTNQILFRARADENTISIQTYTPRMKKSPAYSLSLFLFFLHLYLLAFFSLL